MPSSRGQAKANPLAAVLSGALMMDYLAEKTGNGSMADAARLIEDSVQRGFAEQRIRPMEFGGDMGTTAVTRELIALVGEREARRAVNA